jgi:hypothetical protein
MSSMWPPHTCQPPEGNARFYNQLNKKFRATPSLLYTPQTTANPFPIRPSPLLRALLYLGDPNLMMLAPCHPINARRLSATPAPAAALARPRVTCSVVARRRAPATVVAAVKEAPPPLKPPPKNHVPAAAPTARPPLKPLARAPGAPPADEPPGPPQQLRVVVLGSGWGATSILKNLRGGGPTRGGGGGDPPGRGGVRPLPRRAAGSGRPPRWRRASGIAHVHPRLQPPLRPPPCPPPPGGLLLVQA